MLGVVLVGSAATLPATATATPATPPAWREAAQHLDLSPDQSRRMAVALQPWNAHLARHAGNPEATTLCERSRQLEREARDSARALLTPAQLSRLAQLEQAFLLMPVVESAQNALLLSATLRAPPLGLPQGQADQMIRYQRSAPMPLPGCPAQREEPAAGQQIDRPSQQPTR